jgi:hypothetical protein
VSPSLRWGEELSASGWLECLMSRANCGGFQERFDDDPADLASRLGDPAAQQAMAYVQGSLTTEMSRAR